MAGSELPSLASIDLAWAPHRPSTAALDAETPRILCPISLRDIAPLVSELAEGALLLIDAPLTPVGASYRATEIALMRCGVSCLPPSKANGLGLEVAEGIRALRPDLRLFEAYPYQVYKFLSWLFHRGHRCLPPQGPILDPTFVAYRPPSYKRSPAKERASASAHACNLLRSFCSIDCRQALAPVPGRFQADALDALFMICLGREARRASPWVLLLGDADPPWLVLGDGWLIQRLSSHCACQLYSNTTSEV